MLRELKEWLDQVCTGDTPVILGGDYNEAWYPSDRPRKGTHQPDNDYMDMLAISRSRPSMLSRDIQKTFCVR